MTAISASLPTSIFPVLSPYRSAVFPVAMAIAVSVLLFLIAFAFLINSIGERGGDWISNLGLVASVVLGVRNIYPGDQGDRISTGLLMCIYGVVSIVLFALACKKSAGGGPNDGLGIVICLGAFILMAWVITFAVLQLTIVV